VTCVHLFPCPGSILFRSHLLSPPSFFPRFPLATVRYLPADAPFDKVQFTLVDCPGHASLIRTIIGGAQIIDLMFLVLDINKGIQTQTAEVLVVVGVHVCFY
jgi:hypothetical protein